MDSRFTKKAREALDSTLVFARELGHTYVGTEHLLLGLLSSQESVAWRVLTNHGIALNQIRDLIIATVGSGEQSRVGAAAMTPMTKKVIEESACTASRLGHSRIGTEHILAAIVSEGECYANKMIRGARASVADIRNELSQTLGAQSREDPQLRGHKKEGDAVAGCPTVSKYGKDLCRAAREGRIDPIIGRETETERLVQILCRRTKNNPCLIGEPGVGKTAVVEGLAQRIAAQNVPDELKDKLIVTLDISSMVAGAKYRGEFEERMKNVMDEAQKNPSLILFVDEIHTMIGAGGAEGAVDAANIIKPALARGLLQIIGATTVEEYRKYIEKDASLERRFQSVSVGEPTPEDTVRILKGLCEKYEEHHKLKISDEAIEAAVRLSVRYIGDRYLPDKAIDLIDEAASKLHISGYMPTSRMLSLKNEQKQLSMKKEDAILDEDFEGAARLRDREKSLALLLESEKEKERKAKKQTVGAEDIEDIVTAWTGIPVKRLCGEEGERLLNLERLLKERIIGQDNAVSCVAKAIRRGRVGMKDPARPVGSFLFLGPTGVGKTELTKALTEVLFGDRSAMIRIDMSEYMDSHSTSKLIGPPPGYVGYSEGGQLTKKVRRRPYSVVLFDEIEKAHPDVFNILLQILDDGILTDSQGRRVDFCNTVIVMTSNVGASAITKGIHLGFTDSADDGEDMEKQVKSALKATFCPEFLNRIDETVVFNRLEREHIKSIAHLLLEDVKKRIEGLGISISFDESVAELLAKEGFDRAYGARPLRRLVVRTVEDGFSEAMLSGKIKQGDVITASVKDGAVFFGKVCSE